MSNSATLGMSRNFVATNMGKSIKSSYKKRYAIFSFSNSFLKVEFNLREAHRTDLSQWPRRSIHGQRAGAFHRHHRFRRHGIVNHLFFCMSSFIHSVVNIPRTHSIDRGDPQNGPSDSVIADLRLINKIFENAAKMEHEWLWARLRDFYVMTINENTGIKALFDSQK